MNALQHLTAFRLMAVHFTIVTVLHFFAVQQEHGAYNFIIPIAAALIITIILTADSIANHFIRNRAVLHTVGALAYLLFLVLVYVD
jgi:FtsH-binding integral membrane protein